MLVDIEELRQNLSLDNGQMVTYARIRLPNDSFMQIRLEDAHVEALMKVLAENEQGQAVEPTAAMEYITPPEEVEEIPEEDMVQWAELPDDIISPEMKRILSEINAVPEMPYSALVSLLDDISERMAQEAERRQAAPQPAPQPVQPASSPVGHVRPPVGRVMMPRTPPIRTVPKNDRGYPIVPGMAPSTGEPLVGADEDGVPQV